ncbi:MULTISPECIES: hypothetical protein [unclassified Paenibacillus]|uniref:hypothetical protein n=1 Tax=unclassified Paenibacillus TaxID=185978 RepID=UPI0030F87873
MKQCRQNEITAIATSLWNEIFPGRFFVERIGPAERGGEEEIVGFSPLADERKVSVREGVGKTTLN